ncbi:MAG: DNA mismatch repair endonuclease MutL [Lentisphaeria bacterium]|nr:DNA mismatch repair endonuclease MutL [Lentisphaeria bacterium]
MSSINLLPEHIYNKIAAGEVVERPASVLKELLENALDAHASRITVRVQKGGSELISVTDNGSGMDPDDALLCFEPHATSKIAAEKDLFNITTMGFRGEALPSIASVSKVTLRTRKQEFPEGCEVVLHGGKMISSEPAGCAPGTEIVVRDLFFNTPARKKFLRSRGTEEHHIVEMMTNLALANPQISFELRMDNRIVLSSPGSTDPLPRIRDLFGREFADALLKVEYSERGIGISGYLAKRSFTRPARTHQRLFVNQRCVDSQSIYRAIRDGCGPMLEKGRYQPCILFIALDPALVDVNVHPAKREVRFAREFELASVVRSAVAETLRKHDSGILQGSGSGNETWIIPPVLQQDPAESVFPASPEVDEALPAEKEIRQTPDPVPETENQEDSGKVYEDEPDNNSILDQILRSALLHYTPRSGLAGLQRASELPGLLPDEPEEPQAEKQKSFSAAAGNSADSGRDPEKSPSSALGLRVIGVLNNSYIIAEKDDGLILVDQHAAHERILFEKILKNRDCSLSQRLLIPVTLELTRSEIAFVRKNISEFEKCGFEAEPFGSNTVKLNAIPGALSQNNAGELFKEILSMILADANPARVDYQLIAMSACKAAVKAHDALSTEEVLSLLHQLGNCDLPFACPHGRPTILNISMREIERRFGRK